MRTHAEYSEFLLWPASSDGATILHPDHLAVARFELIKRAGLDYGWLDLVFFRDEHTRVIPGILIELFLAATKDPSSWLWPRSVATMLTEDDAYALVEAVLPAIFRLTQARAIPLESVVRFRSCPPFEAARAAAEVGAGPLAGVLPRLAPWIHAARLAGAGPVEIDSRDAALGAAVLRRYGIAAAGSTDPAAAAWYGVAPAERASQPTAVVADRSVLDAPAPAIGILLDAPPSDGEAGWREMTIPQPVPMDVAVTFDPQAAAVARRFWVRAGGPGPAGSVPDRPPPARTPAVRLAFIVRDDYSRSPEADSDELDELLAWAGQAGLATTLAGTEQIAGLEPRTLPVAFGDLRDAGFRAALEALARRGRPFIAAPQPVGAYPDWHEAALFFALWRPCDDAYLTDVLRAYDDGTIAVEGIPAAEPPGLQAEIGRCAAALASATAILLNATQDLDVIRTSYGGAGRPLISAYPIVPADDGTADAAVLCGREPFVFAHAPAIERSQLITLVLALRDTTIPLVIASEGGVPDYVTTLRRLAGPSTIVATNPGSALVNALYRRAAIVVDASMRPRGLARIVRAARAGALPVVFADSPLATVCGPEATVPRRGIAPLRDTLAMLWHSPLRKNQSRLAQVALGTLDRVPDAVEQLFGLFADIGSLL